MTPKQKILIVDDKHENLVALRHVLEAVDAEVVEASCGNDALVSTLENRFSVAILDVMMPGMDGYELASYLRGDDRTKLIPIIFVTAAHADEQQMFRGYDVGGIDYIVKPFDPQILLGKVRLFLELDRDREELRLHRDHLDALVAERTAALTAEIKERRATAESLREAQRLARIGNWSYDPARNLLEWSDEMFRIWGLDPADGTLPPEQQLDRVHPEDRPLLDAAVREALGNGTPYELEMRVRRPDGQTATVVTICEPRVNADGRTVLLRGTHQDITLRRRVERVQDLSREVLEILNDPAGFVDSVERVLETVRRGTECDALGIRLQEGEDFPYLARYGFSQGFLLKENSLFAHGPDGDICRWPDGSPCLECACGLVLSGREDPANPHPHLTPGGSWWTNDSTALLAMSEDEDPRFHPRNECIRQGYASVALIPIRGKQRIVGLLQINDKRKEGFSLEMVAALEDMASHIGEALVRMEVEDEYRTVFRRMLDGFALHEIICDATGQPVDYRFLAVNPAFERMTGLKAEAVVGRTVMEVLPQNEPHWVETYGKVALTGQPTHFEQFSSELDKHFEVTAFSPRHGRFACIFNDTTERKRGEEERERLQAQLLQSQKLESVGRLAGGVAHDFNNMLQAILGYTEMALESVPPNGPLHEDLQETRKVALRAADLTRQLLAFARKQTVSPKVLDLNVAVEDTLGMLRRLIGENVQLDWVPGPDLWSVKIDPTQVGMVLTNLCVNARDAIVGTGQITIACQNVVIDDAYCASQATATPGEFVVLTVSDDGCGMDEETLSSVFEPFFTTKEVGKGTGLGLATVHGVALQNGGFVHVHSEPGKGTTFRAYLPRHEGEEKPASPVRNTQAGDLRGGSETILVAEDEPDILAACGAALGKLGYGTLLASTPDEAIRLARTHAGVVDLLLSDVVMPGMNGHQLAEELQQLHPGIPSIYMSGYAADAIGHDGVIDQGLTFLPKPFSNRELAQVVRATLDERAAEREEQSQ